MLAGIINEWDSNCLIALVDTTQLKNNEKELIMARNSAEESNRIKSDFLSNMSHEIRTPANAILGFSQLLAKPDIPIEDKKNLLYNINEAGKRLLHLITDILNISKIESGKISVTLSPVNINKLRL